MIQQTAVAVGRLFQLLREVCELLHEIFVDLGVLAAAVGALAASVGKAQELAVAARGRDHRQMLRVYSRAADRERHGRQAQRPDATAPETTAKSAPRVEVRASPANAMLPIRITTRAVRVRMAKSVMYNSPAMRPFLILLLLGAPALADEAWSSFKEKNGVTYEKRAVPGSKS